MEKQRIISVGYSQSALLTRNRRLSEAGFDVSSASDEAAARRLISAGDSAALVTGHLIPEVIRNRLARAAKRVNPQTVVVMLYDGNIENASLADAVLNAATADKNLAETIRHLVSQNREISGRLRRTTIGSKRGTASNGQ